MPILNDGRIFTFMREKIPVGGLLCAGILLVFLIMNGGIGRADQTINSGPRWYDPQFTSIKKVGGVFGDQTQPNLFSNLDCQLLTYRTTIDKTMKTGCFTETAFGMYDSEDTLALFNGSDEAVQLSPYGNNQVIAPWPNALATLILDTASTGGSYLKLNKNTLNTTNQRDYLGRLASKKLATPPDLTLRDYKGNPLVINAQTLSFSSSGYWMAAETMNGAFVRINLATLELSYFAKSFAASGFPGTFKSQVSISDDGRFVAISNDVAESFNVYDLARCPVATSPELTRCESHDYRQYISQNIGGVKGLRHVRFINEGLLSFEANTLKSETSGRYLIAPSTEITHLMDYVALGDSYTSGEGVFDYRADTDTTTNHCHNSGLSYPYLITRALFTNTSGKSVACSGATTWDIYNDDSNYRGQVDNGQPYNKTDPNLLSYSEANFVPGYIAQHRFIKKYQPRIITVSIGGNDIGFGDIVKTCVAPNISFKKSANTCFNTQEDRKEIAEQISRTSKKWAATFQQLKKDAPMSQIYVIGYPNIISEKGSCALNVHLNQEERIFTQELLAQLNTQIEAVAQESGVRFVDISEALNGFRLCETKSFNVAVNGLTSGKDAGLLGLEVLGKESYHPNALGHRLIQQAILKESNNLSSGGNYSQPSVETLNQFLNKPSSGRPVSAVQPTVITKQTLLQKGSKIEISIDGARTGLAGNTAYKVGLGGLKNQIGTISTNADGSISADLLIPDEVEPGFDRIQISGEGAGGQSVTLTQLVFISYSPDDHDGDGVANQNDTCLFMSNSGVDEDNDSIDDSCDPLFNTPSADKQDHQNDTQTIALNNTSHNPPNPPTTSLKIGPASGMPILSTQPKIIATLRKAVHTPIEATQTKAILGTNSVNKTHKVPQSTSSALEIHRYITLKVFELWTWLVWMVFGLVIILLTREAVFKYKRIVLQ